jgi:hypothetical protein
MALYDFRLRFNFAEGYRINSDAEEIELLTLPSGERIKLKSSAIGKPIKDYAEAAIIGKSYTSEAQARAAAEKSKRALIYWAVKSRAGIDFGDGKQLSFFTKEGLALIQKRCNCPVRNDIHGIDVYEHDERTIFFKTDAKATVGKATPRLIETFQREYSNVKKISEKQILASEIYVSSFFDASPRSRFITLVTAIEALLERPKRTDEVKNLVNEFKNKTSKSQLDEATRKSIISSLKEIELQSISQAGCNLAQRLLPNEIFDGQSSDKFFSRCYHIRSRILHDGAISDESVDIRQLANVMESFVNKLLLKLLNSESSL